MTTTPETLFAEYKRIYFGKDGTEFRPLSAAVYNLTPSELAPIWDARPTGENYEARSYRAWIRGAQEQYEGAVRWVRKDCLFREDGSTKNVAIGTRVRAVACRSKGSQRSTNAGFGVVIGSAVGSCGTAKAAIGTSAAMLVRFDPTKVA